MRMRTDVTWHGHVAVSSQSLSVQKELWKNLASTYVVRVKNLQRSPPNSIGG